MLSLSLLLVTLAVWAPLTHGSTKCPTRAGGQGPSLDEMIFKSQIVMMGKVVEQYKNPQIPTAYTAELEVYCIYKGGPLPLVVNVSNAGIVPNACFRTNFTIGEGVLAYLNRHEDGGFSPAYSENPSSYKDEIFVNCGVSIEYPGGLSPANAPYPCDEDYDLLYDETNCLTFKPETGTDNDGTDIEEIEVGIPADGQAKTAQQEQGGAKRPQGGEVPHDGKTGAVEEEEDDNGSASLCMSLTFFLSLPTVLLLVL